MLTVKFRVLPARGETDVSRFWIPCVLALTLWAGPAGSAEYDSRRSGHPLRIAAHALHPVGVLLDYMIFRPAWWVGQHEPFRTLFGVPSDLESEFEAPGGELPGEPAS